MYMMAIERENFFLYSYNHWMTDDCLNDIYTQKLQFFANILKLYSWQSQEKCHQKIMRTLLWKCYVEEKKGDNITFKAKQILVHKMNISNSSRSCS